MTIRRDERGIPHITAANDEDLYFAQGYATASDRLWQMDLFRRTARGELAEVLGTAALEEDKRHRTFGFAQSADAEVAQASPTLALCLKRMRRASTRTSTRSMLRICRLSFVSCNTSLVRGHQPIL